ncbi:hypothetical protein V2J09_016931 [Rumex salicifolius]
MSLKRLQNDGFASGKGSSESINPEDQRVESPAFRNVVLDVMRKHSIQNFLEPMIRRVVKEEIEVGLRNFAKSCKRNDGKDTYDSHISLKLRFLGSLSLPMFTGTRIEGEDGSSVKVALVDAYSEDVIQSGPMSSAKVEIVVLEGDFDGEDGDNWNQEDFKNNVVREREGKKPLLAGDAYLTLKDGTGIVGDISFTDNSSWTRSRRFRLGARLVGNSAGAIVREAKTQSFVVRDHRGELYKKHYPPSLFDEVWRLEKIGKDGAFHKRLSADRVITVKDFLILLNLDPARLRKILGPGMSNKMWDVTVEHALTCVVDKRVYLYYSPGTQPIKCVAFNIAGEVLGLLTENQYVRADKLSENDKVEAKRLAISAFQNWEGVTSFDDENSLLASSSHPPTTAITDLPGPEASDSNKLLPSQSINTVDHNPAASSSDAISSLYPMECLSSADNYGLHTMELDLRYEDPPLGFPSQLTDALMWDDQSLVEAFFDCDHFGLFNGDCFIPPHSFSSILQPSFTDRPVKVAQKRWRLVFNVLQLFFLMRLVVIRRSRRSHRIPRYY